MNAAEFRVEEWMADGSRSAAIDAEIDLLAEVLHAVVHAGAGVSFFIPFSIDEARAFWVDKVLPQVRAGARRVLVARDGERIAGTVQLELKMPPNQQHRAAVAKLLVHPAARRRGIGRALMIALEDMARTEERTLLTLDTVSGSSAESLYRSLDYIAVGIIPRYARGALTSELEGTTIMYKELVPRSGQYAGVVVPPS
ncbi:MAG: GNAT family N-acetyltransferase [Pyrinomonadaceae bacterium]